MTKIKSGNEEIILNNELDQHAQKMVDLILSAIKSKTDSVSSKALYCTIIIELHKKTGDILSNLSVDDINYLMRCWEADNERQKAKEQSSSQNNVSIH